MMSPPGQEGFALPLAVPRLPEPPAPTPFPVLATIAPVLGSLVLWALTTSPFALVFALLGPIIAVASVGDARLSARKHRKAERARFLRECDRTADAIAEAHAGEIGALDDSSPGPTATLRRALVDPQRWRADVNSPLPVTLGHGRVPSALALRTDALSAADASDQQRLDDLAARARVIPHAPVVIDARMGVGVIGPSVLAHAAGRAVTLQTAALLSPGQTTVAAMVPEADGGWATALPHAGPVERCSDVDSVVTFGSPTDPATMVCVASAPTVQSLPVLCRVVMRVGRVPAIVSHPDRARVGEVRPLFVSRREMLVWARGQRVLALAAGLIGDSGTLPSRITLRDALAAGRDAIPAAGDHRLAAILGMASDGPARVDLAADGPHAIVGGTTGSGKSELLLSWVVAMATAYPPSEITFLFVDFKGGAAFDPLRGLPHSVGVITDLDTTEVMRALTSLRAEVRHRERILAAAGLRSLADATGALPMPRLVLVIDEYAALLDEHPQLQSLIADLCARGRSLGIHLILCTQRPSGVVRDGILANCALRISLRVHDRADSVSVVGTPAAAELPTEPVGRAIVAVLGGSTRTVQVATATPDDVAVASRRWAGSCPQRTPWNPPLPSCITAADVAATLNGGSDAETGAAARVQPDGIVFGLTDLPQEQRRALAVLDPGQGSVLVVGAGGSGKTGVLRALAAEVGAVTVHTVSATLPAVWDAAHAALTGPADVSRILLLDDIDAVLASCPDDYTSALGELLYRVLREGPRRGVTCVLTAQRLAGALHSLAALCGSTIVLRMPTLQEHVVAGGQSDGWDPHLPPGAGFWRGNRIQIVATPVAAPEVCGAHIEQVDAAVSRALAIVTTRPRQLGDALRQAGRTVAPVGGPGTDAPPLTVTTGGDRAIPVGDPDGWMSRWGALTALREDCDIVFDGCSVSEFRALTGIRELPPPVFPGERAQWLLHPDGTVVRAVLRYAEH